MVFYLFIYFLSHYWNKEKMKWIMTSHPQARLVLSIFTRLQYWLTRGVIYEVNLCIIDQSEITTVHSPRIMLIYALSTNQKSPPFTRSELLSSQWNQYDTCTAVNIENYAFIYFLFYSIWFQRRLFYLFFFFGLAIGIRRN